MLQSPQVPLKVPYRSGRDISHPNSLTTQVGTITPLFVQEVIPNTKINLRISLAGSLPPLASDTFMRVEEKVQAFFVPMRLLYGGFEDWFNQNEVGSISRNGAGTNVQTRSVVSMPYALFTSQFGDSRQTYRRYFGPGTLSDYLGFKNLPQPGPEFQGMELSLLPYLAYHLIWDTWFRAPRIQNSCFAKPAGLVDTDIANAPAYFVSMLPYITLTDSGCLRVSPDTSFSSIVMADGKHVLSLRQANFGYDYFTNALPSPQLGDDARVTVEEDNAFSISALRAMNSLQQFRERNGLAGVRFIETLKSRYGANLGDAVAQRPVCLGVASYDIYSKSVDVTASNTDSDIYNPFSARAGAQLGRAYLSGSDLLIDGYTANEPGYIFVVGTLVPKVRYGSGTRRYLRHYITNGFASIADMANPILENVGMQPIYNYEVSDILGDILDQDTIFGYTDRYAEFKTYEGEVHGHLRNGESLQSFVFQRYFSGLNTISTEFLEIPTDSLSDVFAYQSSIDGEELYTYGIWLDMDFDCKISDVLSDFAIPSLQDPAYEHGETIIVHRGGFRF